MSQPPPPPQPYPYPYQPQPPKKSNKTVWIILGVIGGLIVLFCGGCLAVGGIFANEVDNAIEEEIENSKPTEIEVGESFEHDDYEAEEGWQVAADELDSFTIENLTVTNNADAARSAWLTFTVYRDNQVVASVDCTSSELQPGDAGQMDCISGDDYTEDYDAVKVADAF